MDREFTEFIFGMVDASSAMVSREHDDQFVTLLAKVPKFGFYAPEISTPRYKLQVFTS